jgi:hypothetical protein
MVMMPALFCEGKEDRKGHMRVTIWKHNMSKGRRSYKFMLGIPRFVLDCFRVAFT